ncbi:MAG: hypothetical protein JSS81_09130 [Acidobacteria bacterium]|nr:hypothetical protein [Acidobacteriota bacterium]
MKQSKNNNFSRRLCGLGIAALTVFLAIGCGRTNNPANANTAANGNTAVNANADKPASTPANSAAASPASAASPIEQKANVIVGKWETTTALDDKIAFDFGQPKKEGDTFVGTYKFIVNDDTSEPPAKYVVSGDKMIKFYNEEGKEYPLIKVSVSDDGKTLTYYDQKGGTSKLTKATGAVKPAAASEEKADCEIKKDDAEFFVSATEKTVKLKKGTPLRVSDAPMNQGIITVKAKVGNDWTAGEIPLDDTTCK